MNVKIIKKILFSMVLSLFSFFSVAIVYGAPESVVFDVEFADQHIYNFETGVFESSPIYASTGRMKIIKDYTSIAISTDFSYIFYWDKAVQYLGYRRNMGNYIAGSKYLGYSLSTDLVPSLPEGAVYFALSSAIFANNYTPSGMNTSIVSAFGNPSYLNYTDSVLTANLGTSLSNPSYLNYLTEYNGMSIEDIFYRGGSAYETPSSEQLLNNPDFTDNIDGYNEESTAEISYDTGKLLMVKNAGNTGYSFNFQTDFIEDHIYFIDVRTQRLDTVTFAMTIEDVGGDIYTSIVSSGTFTDLFMNEYYANYQAISDDVVLKGVGYTFTGGLNNNTTGLYFDYIRAYDLTDIFGSGNEVSADVFHEFLAGDSYTTLRTIQNIGYSGDDLDDAQTTFTARSIPVLTLTNLIHGQFNENIAGWSSDNNLVWYSFEQIALVLKDAQTSNVYSNALTLTPLSNYYMSGNLYNGSGVNGTGLILLLNSLGNLTVDEQIIYYESQNGFTNLSGIITIGDISTGLFLIALDTFTTPYSGTVSFDNLSMFGSGSYTKTQIDNALINFGYLPYNITYYLPDMGASGTGERGFGTCGDGDTCYAVDGSGIGTDLEIYDYYTMYLNGFFTTLSNTGSAIDQWQEWRASYGDRATSYPDTVIGINPYLLPLSVQTDFTVDHTARDYYIKLYKDAVNEVDRWEWYSIYGVTSSNFAYYTGLYADAVAQTDRYEWYSYAGVTSSVYPLYSRYYADLNDLHTTNSADTYAGFQAIEITGVYDLGAPVDPPDVWNSFDNLFTPTIRIFIALIIVVATIVFVALRGGSLVVIVLIVAGELLFAVLANWIPEWVGIVLAIIAFLFFLFTVLKNDSGGGGEGA